eukprot:376366-Ditylum_brightwellii.AAC.1
MVEAQKGIFGGNFGSYFKQCEPCQRAWCGKCYTMPSTYNFPQVEPTNNEGVIFVQRFNKDKSVVGRDGAWLASPFQCDWCWFRNIKSQKVKKGDREDKRLLAYVRQVNLDMLWSQSKSTVRSDLMGMQKGLWMAEELNIPPPYLQR